jgi:HEAT repeat protein
MSRSSLLEELQDRLQSGDAHVRDLAAAELTDHLEAHQFNGTDEARLIRLLIKAALAESNPATRESIFNALSSAALEYPTARVDWDPIADHLDDLDQDCLEHAFVIFGAVGNPKFIPAVERFLQHPDPRVREDAIDALTNLKRDRQPKAKSSRRR